MENPATNLPPLGFFKSNDARTGLVPIADHSIYYERHGSGRVKLVFLSGFLSSMASWSQVVNYFVNHTSGKYECLVLDNRGFGRSTGGVKERYTTSNMAQDAIKVIEYHGWSKVNLIGISMGGMIAQEVALARPDLINALALVSTTAKLGIQLGRAHRDLAFILGSLNRDISSSLALLNRELSISLGTLNRSIGSLNRELSTSLGSLKRQVSNLVGLEQLEAANASEVYDVGEEQSRDLSRPEQEDLAMEALENNEGVLTIADSTNSGPPQTDESAPAIVDPAPFTPTETVLNLFFSDQNWLSATCTRDSKFKTNRDLIIFEFQEQVRINGKPALPTIYGQFNAVLTHNVTKERLKQLSELKEVLVVTGSEDRIIHKSCSEDLAEAIGCKIHIIEGKGHALPRETEMELIEILEPMFERNLPASE